MPTSIDPGLGRRLVLAAMLTILGCGGGPSTSKVDLGDTILEIGPGGGPVVRLDDTTRAELLQQPAPTGVRLVVTLLEADLETPAGLSPSEVSARVFTLSGEQTVSFSADSKTPHVWTSPPGDLGDDAMQGELTVSLGGRPITRPFAFR